MNVALVLHIVTRGSGPWVAVLWSVDTPLESVLELSVFHLVICLVHSHMPRKSRNIRLSVSLVYWSMSIFAATLEPDYTGCCVLDEVGVLKSNAGF